MDIDLLNIYVADKRLRRQVHPTEDLFIWNYTEITQLQKLWDPITTQCRALVTNTDGTIIARSFPKFFNENEQLYEATEEFTVQEKVDGSLGILFHYRDRWIMASRGSFTSPQVAGFTSQTVCRYPRRPFGAGGEGELCGLLRVVGDA
ncbi:uncharacterized protein EV422DRAFT_528387 [Fimicolochytrium jonesii]|uniref:uncharacterized protein n=1 Tax=Fimicolochytrium jonesii TaxID=1396493 RepID=UPI0022FF16F5|nr:uncharacterized protein EV422DRAFT_528387 [Fimicolochytrium jonesii]KAI8821511.1 hypothetical protein EV422DRAFT_528387 [Fimicolochytrium jonesii]